MVALIVLDCVCRLYVVRLSLTHVLWLNGSLRRKGRKTFSNLGLNGRVGKCAFFKGELALSRKR